MIEVKDKECESDEIPFEKEVWRMNMGNVKHGVPSDYCQSVVYANGEIQIISLASHELTASRWKLKGCVSDIAVYQTTHTRKAKHERVECKLCFGCGFTDMEMSFGFTHKLKCAQCNGKGYILEAVK